MSENILFRPDEKIIMECEYFQVKNDIFDLHFNVKSLRPYKKAGKLIADKMILEYRELDAYEKLTYIYLCRCANNKDNAFPSYSGISSKIGCGRSKAIECIRVLNENGFIYKESRKNEKGESTSNLYYINTKLEALKDKLTILYPLTKQEIINKSSIPGKQPSIPGKLGGSIPGKQPSIPGTPKKEQAKKNNIEKEQYKNNNIEKSQNKVETKTNIATKKETIVVVDKDIKLLKMYLDSNNLNIEFSQKDLQAIGKALINKHNCIESASVNAICNIIKDKNNIKNVVGYIIKAIEDDYQESSYAPTENKKDEKFLNDLNKRIEEKSKLRFCDYEQRDYDYDKLERKLLGWDDSEDTKSEENESFGTPKVNLVDAEIKSELKIDDDGTKYNQLTV